MAFCEWDDSIALGIEVIDEQHKALFGLVNKLDEALVNVDGSEVVSEVIWDLIKYVTEHFSAEERLMLSWNYPGLAGHRAEHDQFVTRLQEIQVNHISGHEMGKEILAFLVDWLVCHIKGTDQAYSRFIHAQEKVL